MTSLSEGLQCGAVSWDKCLSKLLLVVGLDHNRSPRQWCVYVTVFCGYGQLCTLWRSEDDLRCQCPLPPCVRQDLLFTDVCATLLSQGSWMNFPVSASSSLGSCLALRGFWGSGLMLGTANTSPQSAFTASNNLRAMEHAVFSLWSQSGFRLYEMVCPSCVASDHQTGVCDLPNASPSSRHLVAWSGLQPFLILIWFLSCHPPCHPFSVLVSLALVCARCCEQKSLVF